MTHTDLEALYSALALKIDAVGPTKSELFLAKLVLLLAQRNGDLAQVQASIDDAAKSLTS